jgi:hypothetical protein
LEWLTIGQAKGRAQRTMTRGVKVATADDRIAGAPDPVQDRKLLTT